LHSVTEDVMLVYLVKSFDTLEFLFTVYQLFNIFFFKQKTAYEM